MLPADRGEIKSLPLPSNDLVVGRRTRHGDRPEVVVMLNRLLGRGAVRGTVKPFHPMRFPFAATARGIIGWSRARVCVLVACLDLTPASSVVALSSDSSRKWRPLVLCFCFGGSLSFQIVLTSSARSLGRMVVGCLLACWFGLMFCCWPPWWAVDGGVGSATTKPNCAHYYDILTKNL